jgi:hypothetical protein
VPGARKKQSPDLSGLCTDTGKLIEHIYGFLMIVEQILAKYADKNSSGKVNNLAIFFLKGVQ